MIRFAVVSAWPDIKNAEYEIIKRIRISAKSTNAECIIVDNEGYIIGENDQRVGEYLSGYEVEFIIALHFITEKLYNVYMYGAMWNPPKFLVEWGYEQESNKYFTYDDYLIYGSRKIDGHLKNLLLQTDKDISGCLHFMTSVPGKPFKPKLTDSARLFYSGINWERISNLKGRHHDLFKALDSENLTRIYGPEKFFDAVPWKGYQTYAGSLPFDGFSVMKAINECGISLVLTSDTHRDAEAVSSRLFESCAAGAVLICDANPYIVREFGDSVLYINYDKKDYTKNVDQIKKHLLWIKDHQSKALELAKKSQAIYIEKFHLDKVLAELLAKHSERKAQVIAQNCNIESRVSVIIRVLNSNEDFLPIIQSLNTQYNISKIDLVIICDGESQAKIAEIFSKNISPLIRWDILGIKLYDDNKRIVTTGEMLVYGLQNVKNDFIALIEPNRVLFSDHLSLCAKQLQDENISMVYSGTCVQDLQNDGTIKRYKHFFGNYHISDIASCSADVDLSSLMFKKNAFEKFHDHLLMLDGREVYSLMIASFLMGAWKFSYKVTLSIHLKNAKGIVYKGIVEDEWQIKLVTDAFKYNQKLANITKQNVHYIDISHVDVKQLEVLLKKFLKSKIELKYPRLLSFIKKIYNKVLK